MYIYTNTYTCTYTYTYMYTYMYTYIYKYMYLYMCVYVGVFVFVLLCGAVSCRVLRVVGWLGLGGLEWCGVVWCVVNGEKVAEQVV